MLESLPHYAKVEMLKIVAGGIMWLMVWLYVLFYPETKNKTGGE